MKPMEAILLLGLALVLIGGIGQFGGQSVDDFNTDNETVEETREDLREKAGNM